MKFARDTSYDRLFDNVRDSIWIPYVGPRFAEQKKRIFVFAHNIPTKAEDYEKKISRYSKRSYWADCIEEYTYCRGDWTEAFRFFIKGAVGLSCNYDENSDNVLLRRVDEFVSRIAYLNFIQDLVIGAGQRANATYEQHVLSRRVNREYLNILDITHCICWGSQVYNSVKVIDGYTVENERSEGRKGFSSALIRRSDGNRMHCLRIFHPSMPTGFKPFAESTHQIFDNFFQRD